MAFWQWHWFKIRWTVRSLLICTSVKAEIAVCLSVSDNFLIRSFRSELSFHKSSTQLNMSKNCFLEIMRWQTKQTRPFSAFVDVQGFRKIWSACEQWEQHEASLQQVVTSGFILTNKRSDGTLRLFWASTCWISAVSCFIFGFTGKHLVITLNSKCGKYNKV